MPTLQNQVIVITGASSGIGAALALEVHRRAGLPVLAARRQTELQAVAAQCGHALHVVCDVTEPGAQDQLLAQALERHGHVDAWVANAGTGITRLPSQLTHDDIALMMRLNVLPAVDGVQAALPHFRQRQAGHFVFVSSLLGRVPFAPMRSAYAAAKAFLNTYAATLRLELLRAAPGVHVSVFSPGVVATDFGKNAVHGGPDSRSLPFAQPVQEVAVGLADLLEHPRADAYSRPGQREQVAGYYAAEDMAAVEAGFLR